MNHFRNTIKCYVQPDSVHITAMAFGTVGFFVGGFVGLVNGFHTALSEAFYNRRPSVSTRQRIQQSAYMVTHMIGQPIVGAVAGTAIALTAPVSIPALYYFYQKAEKDEREKE